MEGKRPTDEQIELVQMIANGLPQIIIAAKMGVKLRTIQDRLARLRARNGLISLHRLCLEYYKNGWIV